VPPNFYQKAPVDINQFLETFAEVVEEGGGKEFFLKKKPFAYKKSI
jgi:hypothetical protein